jgi:RNA polymerase sigma-70 factor (ECF subfamily)
VAYRDDSIEGRLLAGDETAVALVVRWVARALAAARFWSVRDEWIDLHQEAVARVIESLRRGRFDASQDLRTYVQAVARYTALEAIHRRRRHPETALADGPLAGPAAGPDERAAARQIARLALDCATEDCRRLLRAYFYEQKNYAEIAAVLGVPVGTIKSRLARCLEKIRKALAAPPPEPPAPEDDPG